MLPVDCKSKPHLRVTSRKYAIILGFLKTVIWWKYINNLEDIVIISYNVTLSHVMAFVISFAQLNSYVPYQNSSFL